MKQDVKIKNKKEEAMTKNKQEMTNNEQGITRKEERTRNNQ